MSFRFMFWGNMAMAPMNAFAYVILQETWPLYFLGLNLACAGLARLAEKGEW